MKKGFTEQKSFDMVEEKLCKHLEKEKAEMRVLRGNAEKSGSFSYLDYYQKMAELEGQLKVKRLERDAPKFAREQLKWKAKLFGEEYDD